MDQENKELWEQNEELLDDIMAFTTEHAEELEDCEGQIKKLQRRLKEPTNVSALVDV